MPFSYTETSIEGVIIITPQVFYDSRGYFMETYSRQAFEKAGIRFEAIQQNHSLSMRGVLRGLHFQREPYAQAKLVRCTRGEIYDVAVDIRKNSPTYGKWVAATLSEANKKMLCIPRGFAHGFYTLSDVAEVQYFVDNTYAPDYEAGIIWDDPDIAIEWPTHKPILSEKDSKWPRLRDSNP